MDLVLLGNAARSPYNHRRRISVAVAALDVLAGMENQRRKQHGQEASPSGEVRLEKSITVNRSPGGAAGEMIAKLFGEEPSQQIDEDLRRFKWLIGTG